MESVLSMSFPEFGCLDVNARAPRGEAQAGERQTPRLERVCGPPGLEIVRVEEESPRTGFGVDVDEARCVFDHHGLWTLTPRDD